MNSTLKKLLQALLAIALVCYPLMIYLGLETLPLKLVAGVILVLFLLRLVLLGGSELVFLKRLGIPVAIIGMVLATASLITENEQVLLYYPVLVSVSSLAVFAWSLGNPPSMIECFALLADKNLPEEASHYTRKVTFIWCLFFIANGCVALFTALKGDYELWTLYNGLISYILMGLLLGGEWLYRKWVIKV